MFDLTGILTSLLFRGRVCVCVCVCVCACVCVFSDSSVVVGGVAAYHVYCLYRVYTVYRVYHVCYGV